MIAKKYIIQRSEIPQLVEVFPPESQPLGIHDYLNIGSIKQKIRQDVLERKLRAATIAIENWTGRCIITRTIDQIYDYDTANNPNGIPFYLSDGQGELEMRATPVRKIVDVHVRDPFRAETLVDPSVYVLQDVREPFAKFCVRLGKVWPGILSDLQAIRIRCICGHATLVNSIDIGTNILTAKGHPYQNGDLVRFCFAYDGSTPPVLPDGITQYTNYTALNVNGNTFQISLDGVTAVDITSIGAGKLFAGEIPEPLLRAIMETAVSDLFGDSFDEKDAKATEQIPAIAIKLCRKYKRNWM